MKDRPLLCFFGHHKAASTWVTHIFRQACSYAGLRHRHFHGPAMFGHDLKKAASDLRLDALSYTNADFRYVEQLDRFLGFHVIRDPRDVCVSAYFSHVTTHETTAWPELEEYRKRLSEMTLAEGMIENMRFTARLPFYGDDINYFDCLRDWPYGNDSTLEVKYEDMIQNPMGCLTQALAFVGLLDQRFLGVKQSARVFGQVLAQRIGLPARCRRYLSCGKLPAALLHDMLERMSFQRLTKGRTRGKEDRGSHMRKGIAGDWRNYFTPPVKEEFKASYADLLVCLGYEGSNDW